MDDVTAQLDPDQDDRHVADDPHHDCCEDAGDPVRADLQLTLGLHSR